MIFYKIIDDSTVEVAQRPLKIDGQEVFTNNKELYNQQGYFELKTAEYPEDGKNYKPQYTLQDGYIVQSWHELPTVEIPYEEKVVSLIREKYSLDEELAIQRQRDTKPEEFKMYFEYCESCKQRAKGEI